MPGTTGGRQPPLHAILAAAIGIAVLLATLPAGFVAGTSDYWRSPGLEGIDGMAALTGLRYFLADVWRFPLLDIPNLGAPGTSAVYTDSIPLLAIAMKLLGIRDVNPYGWWVALSYVLTPVAAVRVARLIGVRSVAGACAVAIFAATLPVFQLRVMHATLTAQFLILVALEAYFRRAAGRPWRWLEALLPAFALGIHPYMLAFCLAPLAAGAVSSCVRERTPRRAASAMLPLLAGLAAAAALAVAIGIHSPHLGAEREWGNYSANLLSPFWPRFSAISAMPFDAVANPSQADGCLWLGFGVAGLAFLAFVSLAVPENRAALRRHRAIIVAAMACLAFAVTTRPSFGPWTFGFYPEPFAPVLEAFRASGRFAWVAAWLLVVGGAAMACRLPRGGAMLLALALLQAYDTGPARDEAFRSATGIRAQSLPHGQMGPLFADARKIEVHPPYDCITTPIAHDVSIEIILLASETSTPIDSARTARRPTDCQAAAASGARPGSEPGTLRLFLDIGEPRTPDDARPPQWTAQCRTFAVAGGGAVRACGG